MLDMRIKKLFFDKTPVVRAVDRARKAVLSKSGAYIRQRAKTSIRPRKGVSAPGEPPHSHEGTIRQFLLFGYDPSADSVVVGPAATNQTFFDNDGRPVKGTVPAVLEAGGKITIKEVYKNGRWQRMNQRARRQNAGLKTRRRTVTIKARPFMGPALEAERPNLPALWRNSVRESAG